MSDLYTELSELYKTTPIPSTRVMPNPVNMTTPKNDYLVGNSYSEEIDYSNLIPTIIKSDDKTNTFIVLTEDDTDKINDIGVPEAKDVIIKDAPSKNITTNDYIHNYGKNYALQFYLGSITVVGLFVFFRMIQKSR